MRIINSITLTLIILGAINWGIVAFFQFDLVSALFGGPQAFLSRLVYGAVGLSGLYYLTKTLYPIGVTNTNTVDTLDTMDGSSKLATEISEELDITNDSDVDDPTPHSMQTYESYRRPTGRED